MMDNWRRRLGRFGSVPRVALAATIAVLTVSPAIAPMTGSHLDGIGRAVAKAVFGEPVHAQEPLSESLVWCLATADADRLECLDNTPWYRDWACWAVWKLDKAACYFKVFTG